MLGMAKEKEKEMKMVMEMVTTMARETLMKMNQQIVTARAMEKWIAMARETEHLTATALAMPRQRQALSAKTNLEEEAAGMIDTLMGALSFPQ
jgi:hypothetical protein